jgi:hypothetical protein
MNGMPDEHRIVIARAIHTVAIAAQQTTPAATAADITELLGKLDTVFEDWKHRVENPQQKPMNGVKKRPQRRAPEAGGE